MPPSPNQLLDEPLEHAVSREDFELLQRFLRVARLLNRPYINGICGDQGDAASMQTALSVGANGEPSRPGPLENPCCRTDASGVLNSDYGNRHGYENGDDEDDEDVEDEDEDFMQVGDKFATTNAAGRHGQPQEHQRGGIPNQPAMGNKPQRLHQPQGGCWPTLHPMALQMQQQMQQQRQQQQPAQPQRQCSMNVEERRRSVMNHKIQQLNNLIPPNNTFVLNLSLLPPDEQRGATGTSHTSPSKSAVLERATQYLKHLVSKYEEYENENNDLRCRLQMWLDEFPTSEPDPDDATQV